MFYRKKLGETGKGSGESVDIRNRGKVFNQGGV